MLVNPDPLLGQRYAQLRQDFSSHLRAVAFGPTDTKPSIYSEDFTHYGNDKKFRKYYGKKVTTMAYLHQTKPLNMPRYCKVLKTLSIYCSRVPKHLPKSLKALHISKEYSNKVSILHKSFRASARMDLFLKRIGYCKGLESLKMNMRDNSLPLKKLLALPNLHSLALSLLLSERLSFSNRFQVLLGLSSLQWLRLTITKVEGLYFSAAQQVQVKDFYSKLFALRNLSRLEFELCNVIHEQDLEEINDFFEKIGQSQISSFHVKLIFNQADPLIFNYVNVPLNNIDLFTMYFDKEHKFYFSCNNSMTSTTPQRKLDIYSMLSVPTFHNDTGAVYSSSGNSYNLGDEPEDQEHSEQFDLTESLTKIFKNIWDLPFPREKTLDLKNLKVLSFDLRLNRRKGPIIKELTDLLTNVTSLEHLGLTGLGSRYLWSDPEAALQFFASVANLKNLKSLNLEGLIEFSNNVNRGEILEEMKSLIKRVPKLSMKAHVKDYPSFFVGFLECGRMSELHLELAYLGKREREAFVKVIHSLTELEKLTIESGSQLLIEAKDRQDLVLALRNMKKLKEVVMPFNSNVCWSLKLKEEESKVIISDVHKFTKELFLEKRSMGVVDININDLIQIKYTRS